MYETEMQALPETYFNVDVAGLAKFVIAAADEDFAFLRLREYCKDNLFLGIDPDSHFDIFNQVQHVNDEDARLYRKTQISQNIVRMMSFTEMNVIDLVPELKKNMRINAPSQLMLFTD